MKIIKHFRSSHLILLVGEGDFSFSLCLAKAFGSASNMVATSLDSLIKGTLSEKYSKAMMNLEELKELGCTFIHGVDAFTMSRHPLLRQTRFDRIVFNFPHARFVEPETSAVDRIKRHQKLVMGFMGNARVLMREDGEIHVTHKKTYRSEWEIETLASRSVLYLKEEEPFSVKDYAGYCDKRENGDTTFDVRGCSTFKFIKDSNDKSLTRNVSELPI